ncbi:glycosyltransferase [Salinimicrobium sp. TH3]|uniref:glycosyltransferase n=1 Tax=Salinimicrobium sp. TH3 TaxID=2997342 RepID=UPI002274F31B|nr:glycosyltransferase [Salinimicrobium sp. TH3]MCY2686977.1 glycosyltransferase [Salinimicrobium sp. TH3]
MTFKEFKSKFEFSPVKEFSHQVKENPLVSVCVQAYNHEKFISQCLKSILSQKTDFPFEILLSEDESSDDTRAICIDFALKYPYKIRLFLHSRSNNIRVSDVPTGNFPILNNFFHANGKYVAICEGDDFWGDPYKLQKQFSFMEQNLSYSICYHNYKILNANGQIISFSPKACPIKRDLKADELIFSFVHPAPLTIFFRNILNKDLPQEIANVIAMDVFLCSLLGEKGPGKFLQEIQPAYYRTHEEGMWSNMALEPKLYAKINTYQQLTYYYSKQGKRDIVSIFQKKINKIKRYLVFLNLTQLNFRKTLLLIKNWKKLTS